MEQFIPRGFAEKSGETIKPPQAISAERTVYVNNPIIPRLNLGQEFVREETVRHHMTRYKLAGEYVKLGSSVVDICCGTGYGTEILRNAGAKFAIGVDLSTDAIRYAREKYPHNIYVNDYANKFLDSNQDLKQFPQPEVVTFFEAIEHLERPDGLAILDSVQNTLAENGHFFISTPRDIRADVNPDHITQWTFEELKTELSKRFGQVDIFGQDWATGDFVRENPQFASFMVARCSQPIKENPVIPTHD